MINIHGQFSYRYTMSRPSSIKIDSQKTLLVLYSRLLFVAVDSVVTNIIIAVGATSTFDFYSLIKYIYF